LSWHVKGLTQPVTRGLTPHKRLQKASTTACWSGSVPVTIHDVARRAKVSASTVSRALSASHHVRGTTRDRVLAAARELGYQPNPAAQSLITGKTGNIGIVVPDLGNPFYTGVLRGVQARARADGTRSSSPTARRTGRGGGAGPFDVAAGRRRDHLCAVRFRQPTDRTVRRHLADAAQPAAAGRTGGVHGRRHMAIVEFGPFEPKFEGGVQAADLALASGVSAIIAYNDLMALGVLSRLADRQVAVPQEMSVVGFDNLLYAAICAPPLTTVAIAARSTPPPPPPGKGNDNDV
jgi:DNA-binding LacI/PurR family transcriptional regulator